MVEKIMRRYGWRKEPADARDRQFAFSGAYVADHIDLRMFCSPVEDQGDTSSCTGNATVGALELLLRRDKKTFTDLSRLFPYYNARAKEGTADQDSGAYIRDVMQSLSTFGICPEMNWPFTSDDVTKKPTDVCYALAALRKISSYHCLTESQQCLESLTEGNPVVFGIDVYESFESDAVAQSGVIPMPAFGEKLLGGHALCMVGYDRHAGYAIVRNSWGAKWGQGGYMMLPFEYMQKYGSDFWCINN